MFSDNCPFCRGKYTFRGESVPGFDVSIAQIPVNETDTTGPACAMAGLGNANHGTSKMPMT